MLEVEESEMPGTSDAATISGLHDPTQSAQEELNSARNSALSPQTESQMESSSDQELSDHTNANNLAMISARGTLETSMQNSATMTNVATIAAPLVMTALSWLGQQMVNSLRSNEEEPTVVGNHARVGSRSDSDSSDEDGQSENGNDESDEEIDSSSISSDSLIHRFDINSQMLEMLSDIGDLSSFNHDHEDEAIARPQHPSSGTAHVPDTRPKTPLTEEKTCTVIESEEKKECVICCDSTVNTVVYTCGHACMCYECSKQIMRDRRPCCPICRARVKDIIRVYQA